MKWLIGLIVIAGLLLAGCPQPSAPMIAETPEPPAVETPADGETEPPEQYDKTWISPPSVTVEDLYPGAENVEWPLRIHNGKDEPAEFSVTYKEPSNTGEGFVAAPPEAKDWVIIEDPEPMLAAKETKNVLIAVEVPEDAEAPPKWEFWIAVKDVTQMGMVQTELTCRCLVTMK
jgi:hypothetical protein